MNLLETLRRHWGYGSFRPLQERIVSSLRRGRDVCVVMPTGGEIRLVIARLRQGRKQARKSV